MRAVAPEVWVDEIPHKFMGLHFGARMTVVRLPDGGLWLHSPVAHTPERQAAVEALGPIRYLVAPSLMHHVFVGAWAAACPEASVWAHSALPKKQKSLKIHGFLDRDPAPWAAVMDQVLIEGNPTFCETVFFHRPSRTLISADLCLNITASPSWWTRVYLKLNKAWGRPAMSRVLWGTFKDKAATRASIERIQAFGAERLIISHGEVIEEAEAVRAGIEGAYSFLGR